MGEGRRESCQCFIFPSFVGRRDWCYCLEVDRGLPESQAQSRGAAARTTLPPSLPTPPPLETAELQLPCGQRKEGCAESYLLHSAEQLQRRCISAAWGELSIYS